MIKLELTVEEVQLVLSALSQLPYVTSAKIIDTIKSVAEKQLADQRAESVSDKTKQ